MLYVLLSTLLCTLHVYMYLVTKAVSNSRQLPTFLGVDTPANSAQCQTMQCSDKLKNQTNPAP